MLSLDEITDALVDLPRDGDENWMPLFVVLADGVELDEDLTKRIARAVREQCSPRHVPSGEGDRRGPADALGQGARVPVKRILMGTDPDKAASRESLANPEALDYFAELAGDI